jgi:hypothetical protein
MGRGEGRIKAEMERNLYKVCRLPAQRERELAAINGRVVIAKPYQTHL